MAIGNPIATVIAVTGVAYARNAEGELRTLKPGDVLLEGETLVTPEGSSVELATHEAQMISVRESGEMLMSPDILATAAADGGESALEPETLDQILQVLAEGGDLTELLEATAAGPGAGAGAAGNEGGGIVQLSRIVESIDPANLFDIPPLPPTEPEIINEFTGIEEDAEDISISTAPVRATETDEPLVIELASAIGISIADAEGDEVLQAVTISFDRLPAGTTAFGDASLAGNVLTVNLDADGNLPASFGIVLPTDYSTAGIAGTPINSGAPIVYTVNAVSNEGSDSASGTLTVGVEEDLEPFDQSEGEPIVFTYFEDQLLELEPQLDQLVLPSITDADGSEQFTLFTATMDNLPAGTSVNGGTLVGNVWTGTQAEFAGLVFQFPDNFAGTVTGVLTLATDEGGGAGYEQPFEFVGIPAEDIELTAAPVTATETDGPLPIEMAGSITAEISDTDGSEVLQSLTITFDNLPVSTTALGDASLSGNVLTVNLLPDGSLPASFGIVLPTDYSTAGVPGSPINDGAPINYTVDAVSNEGSDSIGSTLTVGVEEDLAPYDEGQGEEFVINYTEDAPSVPLALGLALPFITDADGSEQYVDFSLTFDNLPAGTTVNGGTLSVNSWSGNLSELEALSLLLPADFAGEVTGVLTVRTDESGEAGFEQPIRIQGTPTEDIDVTAEDILSAETDGVVHVNMAGAVDAQVTDADGSETLTSLAITFIGLPAGAVAYGDAVLVGNVLTVNLDGDGNLPATFGISFPADYSTAGIANSPDNTGAPISYSVLAVSNEGQDTGDGTVTLAVEEDLSLTVAPEIVDEDSGPEGSGAVIDLNDNITALVTDADNSEQLTGITVTLSNVPEGSDMTGWTDLSGGSWSFSWVPADGAFVLPSFQVPQNFNTEAGLIQASVTATTDEGGDQTKGFSISVTPVNDTPELEGDARESVDEAALADGSQRGVEAGTATTLVAGMLVMSDIDGDTLTIKVDGTPVGVYDEFGPRTLLGTVNGDYGELSLYSDGYWEYQLLNEVPHDTDTTPYELFGVTVNDGTIDSASISLRVDINNDLPLTFELNTVLYNDLNATATAPFAIYGADNTAAASVLLAATVDGDGVLQATSIDGDGVETVVSVNSDGEPVLTSYDSSTGVLTAYVAGDANADGIYTPGVDTAVFTVTTDPVNGTYTVDLHQTLDVSREVPFTFGAGGDFNGGNQDNTYVFKDTDGNDQPDPGQPILWITGVDPDGGGSKDTVNWNNNGLGVGTAAAINDGEDLFITMMDDSWAIPGTALDDTGNEIPVSDFEKTSKATVGFVRLAAGEQYTYTLLLHVDTDNDGMADTLTTVYSSTVITAGADNESLVIDEGVAFDTIQIHAEEGSSFLVSDYTLFQDSDLVDLAIDFTGTITDADTDDQPIAFTVKFDGTGSPLEGTDEGDLIQGGSGDDELIGYAGDDVLVGGAGDDILYGDNDDLTGVGVDTFKWGAGDEGSAGAPAVDTIKDFNINPLDHATDPGDVIDLSDLLDGEDNDAGGVDAGNLENYLFFQEDGGGNTILHISSSGSFNPAAPDLGLADQQIIFEGVELVGALEQEALIQSLLDAGKLITD